MDHITIFSVFHVFLRFIASLFPARRYPYRRLPCCKSCKKKHACTHIRLLNVIRADDERIECTITEHALADAAPIGEGDAKLRYHCLSYTWGDPFPPPKNLPTENPPVPVGQSKSPEYVALCDGHPVPISFNLWSALIHLQKNDRSELRAIWIDQICINQADRGKQVEKSSQVTSMHRIYEGAESVVVWLGPERAPSENLDLIMEIGQELNDLELKHLQAGDDVEDSHRFGRFKDQLTTKFGFEHWTSLHYFLCRSYFSRMWIFQEFVVANKFTIFCGNRQLPWLTIRNLSQAFVSFGFDALAHYAVSSDFRPEFSTPHSLEMWRKRFFKDGGKSLRRYLGGLITGSSRGQYSCAMGHDMLYAHFGVCRFDDIEVDYGKTTEEVYTEFWGWALNKVRDINFLGEVEADNGNPRRRTKWMWPGWERLSRADILPRTPLPSWVPDFQVRRQPPNLTGHYAKSNPRGGPNICTFGASGLPGGDDMGETDLSISHDCLSVSGYHISTIAESSECMTEIDAGGYCVLRLMQLIVSICNGEGAYPTMEERLFAILKTASIWSGYDGSQEEYLSSKELRDRFSLWLLFTLCLPIVHNKLSKNLSAQSKLLEQLQQDERLRGIIPSPDAVKTGSTAYRGLLLARSRRKQEGDDSPMPPLHTIHSAPGSRGREAIERGNMALEKLRLFQTDSNHVGKGPQSLEPGDEIWIFPGGYVPFLLRRVGRRRHALVGHAYVHGIMEGELVEKLKEKRPELVVIR